MTTPARSNDRRIVMSSTPYRPAQASQRPALGVQAARLIDLFIGQPSPTSLDAETSKHRSGCHAMNAVPTRQFLNRLAIAVCGRHSVGLVRIELDLCLPGCGSLGRSSGRCGFD